MLAHRTACCLLILTAAQVLAADPDEKEKDKDKEKAPPPRLVTTGQAVGTISDWNETEGKFTLHIKVRYAEANAQAQQSYAQDLQNLQTRQLQILQNKNPVQRQKDLVKLFQDMANLQNKPQNFYEMKEKEVTAEVVLADDVKVRVASPPAAFDDKGNVKAYTPQELKDLKGTGEDAKLPGYTAERDSIRNGQMVMITTGYKVGAKDPVPEAEKKPDPPPEKKPDAPEKKAPPKPKVVTIVILSEPKN